MITKYIFSGLISLFLVASPVYAADEPVAAEAGNGDVYDPLEELNRVIFELNLALDTILFRPLAEFYGEVVPETARTGVHNVVSNLASPVVLINDILQLNPERAVETFARFVINTIFGIGGLVDLAGEMGIDYHHEDFGQTMASYGVTSGPYIVLPILGPSNLRDVVGKVADICMDPLMWTARNNDLQALTLGRTGADALDTRTEARSLTDRLEKTLDPYAQYRTLYTQNRNYNIGNENEADKVDTSDLPGADEED